MANVGDDRWGSFWVWATILIVLLTIVVAWLSATNRVDDDIPARAPATTGAATPRTDHETDRRSAIVLPAPDVIVSA